jgi:hypothetical protein
MGVLPEHGGGRRQDRGDDAREDFVEPAVTEIRQFGSQSIQVARRLRAMVENLIQTLPEGRMIRKGT